MNHPTLFDSPPVYSGRFREGDPETSREAARSITPGVEQKILDVFAREPHPWYMGGFTADELEARLPLVRRDTLRSALSRMHKPPDPLLVDSGERRKSSTGRAQIVWRLAS